MIYGNIYIYIYITIIHGYTWINGILTDLALM